MYVGVGGQCSNSFELDEGTVLGPFKLGDSGSGGESSGAVAKANSVGELIVCIFIHRWNTKCRILASLLGPILITREREVSA